MKTYQKHKVVICSLTLAISLGILGTIHASAQETKLFFPSAALEKTTDKFGNTYVTGPADAVIQFPADFETATELHNFDMDNKWMICPATGRDLVMSHGPGMSEDAPELTMVITVAFAGKYEVIFHFMDSYDTPNEGVIKASLNDGEAQEYSAANPNAVKATGGTSPGYPMVDGTYTSGMYWYTAVMGTVDLQVGGTVTLKIDDVQGTSASEFMASVFEGVTLRVIEGGPEIPDIRASTEFRYTWGEDKNGNRYTTQAADDSLTVDDVFTTTRTNSDSLWELRTPNMGPYGFIYSGYGPAGTEDCPMLKVIIEIAVGGSYDVYMYLGDVAQVGTDDLTSPCPIKAGFDSTNLKTYFQADGKFIGLYGFNVLQVPLGTVTVADKGVITVYIDDADQVEGSDRRSNYGGLLLTRVIETSVGNWSLY